MNIRILQVLHHLWANTFLCGLFAWCTNNLRWALSHETKPFQICLPTL
ncbi:unnamed protein product, partial [Choristocarpus tenellus]